MANLRMATRIAGLGLGGGILIGAAIGAPAAADVNDFSYDRWHVEIDLDVDTEGRATADVSETLVARFPEFDQNKGLVRGLPIDYEGASTDPSNFSVTDASGNPVPYWTETSDGFVAVLTGTDEYVHGVQTYEISYTLRDVVLTRDDGAADEFYWDILDLEHAQPIDQFSAEIRFAPELASALNGNSRCYMGVAYSQEECELQDANDVFRVPATELGPREGVTVAIGMAPGTVVQPPARLPNFTLGGLPALFSAGALAAGTTGVIAIARLQRKRKTYRGTVVAQYDVPDYLPPLITAPLTRRYTSAVPAEFVHLAVCGATRIEETTPEPGLFGTGKPQPQFRLLDPSRVQDPLDHETLQQLFGGAAPGALFTLPKNSSSFGQRMQRLNSRGMKHAKERGYFTKERSLFARTMGLAGLVLVVAAVVLTVLGIDRDATALRAITIIVGALGLLLSIWSIPAHRVYTPLGAETREYLEGVRLFIQVAEADRIRMLQSHSGAERQTVDTVDVVHLYERLLPYAMVFRLEKEWSRVLEVTYRDSGVTAPIWYPGLAAHGIGTMSSTLTSFTSSLSSAASYTSSSSGGSSGGGFSGGGGGGGFSGGR